MVSGPTSSALCRRSEEGQSARSQQWLHLPCPGPCTRTPLPPFCGPHRCPENWLWGEGVVLPPHYRGEAGVPIRPPDSQVLAFTRGTEVFRALNLGKKCDNSFSKFHNHQGNPKTLISRAEFIKVKACSNFESLTPLFSILGCKQWKAALTFLSRRGRIGGTEDRAGAHQSPVEKRWPRRWAGPGCKGSGPAGQGDISVSTLGP